MALKGLIQLFFLFLLVFLGACSTYTPSTSSSQSRMMPTNRAPAMADDQIIFHSMLVLKSHGIEYKVLLGPKDGENAVVFCSQKVPGVLLLKGAELDLDALKAAKLDSYKSFYSLESKAECAKLAGATKFIDSGAPLIINLDRDRKKVLTFFY